MIYLYFTYKGTPVKNESFDLEYTEANLRAVDSMLAQGLIAKPENYDRIIKREHATDEIWFG